MTSPDLLALSLVVSPATVAPPDPLQRVIDYAALCPLPVGCLDRLGTSEAGVLAVAEVIRWQHHQQVPVVEVAGNIESGDWGPAGRH